MGIAKKNEDLQAENTTLLQDNLMMRKQASLQAENALLAKEKMLMLENARLARENMIMRMQSQSMTPMYDPAAMQDSHGCMRNPWGVPELACPTMFQDGTMKNSWSEIRAKKASGNSWGSISTATGGSSFGPSSFGPSCAGDDEPETKSSLAHTLPQELTTVMMRNIPNNLTREQLLALVNDGGFQRRYDLLYLPMDLKKQVGLGYAFINFVSHEDAEAFAQHFRGFKEWKMQSEKVCEITWSDALQGLDAHVQRYRDCPVMHDSLPDEFKPVLFKDGVRVPFPKPTKRIRAPRLSQLRANGLPSSYRQQ